MRRESEAPSPRPRRRPHAHTPPPPKTKQPTHPHRIKYYNNCLFHSVQRDFIAQTGDPSGSGAGGQSVWGVLQQRRRREAEGGDGGKAPPARGFFRDELSPRLTHTRRGLVGMASGGKDANASAFYVTLGSGPFRSLDGKQTLFGEVVEERPAGAGGAGTATTTTSVLERLNDVPVDGAMAAAAQAGAAVATRPCRNVR